MAPYAVSHGFDTVLVNRLVKRETLDKTPGVKADKDPEHKQNLSDDLQWSVASPDYPGEFEVVTLRTSLYAVATEELLWSADSQTLIANDVSKRIRPYVKPSCTPFSKPA